METITQFVSNASDFLWNVILIILLCGTGIFFTFRLKFIQVRKFKDGLKIVFGNMKLKGDKSQHGEMTPFQSVATAIAAQVGTGNLTGAATALIGGGPGAIFWMWVSAFFGMATIYGEAVLAQKFKTVKDGEVTGGPVYYIRQAFKGRFGKILAACFAVFIILALGFMGNMVQSNSISAAFTEVFQARNIHVEPVLFGVILAVITGFIFLGGVGRLSSVVEKLVPIMAGIYIVGSVALILMHITAVPEAFRMIIVGAFQPKAVLGAGAGIAVREAIRYGVARGLFSNEAGMGSTPHAHARAKAKNPHEQGLAAMISVFIDTFIILNLTVFSILTTGVLSSGKEGTALTQSAFCTSFSGFGDIFVAICLFFFAFSTILGWHFFGQVNVQYLFGRKMTKIYSLIVVLFVIVGSALKVDLVWSLSDFFNGLMVIPNALALLALSGTVVLICKTYDKKDSKKS
ncbi:MAG TPA: sodium:alanine symporter family protein [Candidatus Onthocola gallistercoris]|uniref:Sodium:alanine symporter family protein n=1 Tax=Candidatus Onthocola gallistercoris TaxID=2840876 RepID=A0A9D1HH90_9FIRM|nr:sodium:alanine symporter family protein [Candidatus Onthocola gallistercoris]